jgi:hypothetical protein
MSVSDLILFGTIGLAIAGGLYGIYKKYYLDDGKISLDELDDIVEDVKDIVEDVQEKLE